MVGGRCFVLIAILGLGSAELVGGWQLVRMLIESDPFGFGPFTRVVRRLRIALKIVRSIERRQPDDSLCVFVD